MWEGALPSQIHDIDTPMLDLYSGTTGNTKTLYTPEAEKLPSVGRGEVGQYYSIILHYFGKRHDMYLADY